MDFNVFRVVLTDAAVEFLRSMPEQARDKMNSNISRASKGEKNAEIFKKLHNTENALERNSKGRGNKKRIFQDEK